MLDEATKAKKKIKQKKKKTIQESGWITSK